MTHRFYIILNGVKTEVHPLEVGKLKKVTAREKEQVFYRTKLNGSVVLDKSGGFAYLHQLEKSADRCSEIKFLIEKNCAGFWQTDWQGYFSCNDVKWDEAKCTASFTPSPDDAYRPVLENYGKPVNILTGTTPVSVTAKLDFAGDFEFKSVARNGLMNEENADTWAVFMEVKNSLVLKVQDILFRLLRNEPLVNGNPPELEGGWVLISTDATTAYYAKAPDLYEFTPYVIYLLEDLAKYPELELLACGDTVPEGYVDTGCRELQEGTTHRIAWALGHFTYTRNRTFTDVVRHLTEQSIGAAYLPTDLSAVSRFFHEATNYVTGKSNTLTGLHVASLSDVIGYNSSEAATKAEISLKAFLDNLRKLFRVFWDITPEGFLRLEHESFYLLQGEVDLTIHEKQLRGTEQYEYEKSEMPRYQRLTFSNASNEDFLTGTIEYGGVCVNREEGQDTEEEQITDISTDLEYLIVSGGGTGQRGFVLMLTAGGSVLEETGDVSGQSFPNAGLSAANLVRDYYTHNRVLENGLVNNKIRIFKSVNKTKKQVPLKNIPGCCEALNPYAKYVSTLGANATLETVSQNLSTGSLEYVLLHDTTGTGEVPHGRQFDDSFDASFN